MEESDLFKNLSTFTFPKPVPLPNDGSEDVESIETTASSDNEVYPLGNKSTISPKATIFVGELNKPSSPNSSTAMPNHKRITNLVYSNCNENGLSLSLSPGKSAGVNRTISFPPISPINTKFEWDKSPRQPTLYKTRSSATMESSFYQSPNTLQSSPQSDDYATARYLNDNRPLSSPSERGSFASSGRKFHHRRSLSISSPKSTDFSPNSNRFSFVFSNVEETNTSNYHLEVSREFHDTAPIDCEAQDDFILEEEDDCDHNSYSEEPLMLYKNFDDRNTDIVSRPTASSSGVSIGEAQKVKIQRPSVVYLVSSPTNLELDLDIISNTEQ